MRLVLSIITTAKARLPFLLQVRHTSRASLTPAKEYDRLVQAKTLRNDPYQRKILESLSYLHEALQEYTPPEVKTPSVGEQLGWKYTLFKKLLGRDEAISTDGVAKGIYLYGDVGCGKTMLMDLFYSTIPPHLPKRRMHFHQFMQYVHKRSHELVLEHSSGSKEVKIDTVPILAAEIAKRSRVLCFDEFQVTDVADAMMLRRLLTYLLSNRFGVVLFATSNRRPDDLYMNGVQRETFIPCIELLKERTEVIHLNSPTDYRKVSRPSSNVYYFPKGGLPYHSKECRDARKEHVKNWFEYYAQFSIDASDPNPPTSHEIIFNYSLKIWGRELIVPKCVPGRVAEFTFEQLCDQPLAAGDYLTLANSFRAFIITDIPYLSISVRGKIRRFITFLDAIYDNNCKIASTGAADYRSLFVEPEDILSDFEVKQTPSTPASLTGADIQDDEALLENGFSKEVAHMAKIFSIDEERFAFARALSRLTQMSSTDWVQRK